MSWFKILVMTAVVVFGFGIAPFDCAVAGKIEELERRIAKLEALLSGITRDGADITFKAVNVHIVSGSGSTNGDINGLGNLIVGYDEPRQSGNDKTGSHNIVVGPHHNYSLFGGLVVGNTNAIVGGYATVTGGMNNEAIGYASSVSGGSNNTAGNFYASVSGGSNNIASGLNAFVGGGGSDDSRYGNEAYADYSAILGGGSNFTGDRESNDHSVGAYATVSGGSNNTASGGSSSVSGGASNTASDGLSSVSGGVDNTASGYFSSVSGGAYNTASAEGSSVSGGWDNTASIIGSSVSGGSNNTASGVSSSVSGGRYNVASGTHAFVGGGGGARESDGNQAFAKFSSILGGWRNIAGDPDLEDDRMGRQSVVSAGSSNVASGNRSAVSGGYNNTASAAGASVSGGRYNNASALGASVSGGNETSVANRYDWAAGDLYEAD